MSPDETDALGTATKKTAITLQCEYALNDKVRILPIERVGRVVAIWWGDVGTQFQVRYFDNASPQIVYFFPDELELVGEGK
jgi:hypothetical protein